MQKRQQKGLQKKQGRKKREILKIKKVKKREKRNYWSPFFRVFFKTNPSYVRQQITRDSWANPDAAFDGSSNSSDKLKANRVRSCEPSLIAHKTSNHGCPYRLRGCCRPRRRPRLRDPPVSVRPRRREPRPRRSPARGRRLNFFFPTGAALGGLE